MRPCCSRPPRPVRSTRSASSAVSGRVRPLLPCAGDEIRRRTLLRRFLVALLFGHALRGVRRCRSGILAARVRLCALRLDHRERSRLRLLYAQAQLVRGAARVAAPLLSGAASPARLSGSGADLLLQFRFELRQRRRPARTASNRGAASTNSRPHATTAGGTAWRAARGSRC